LNFKYEYEYVTNYDFDEFIFPRFDHDYIQSKLLVNKQRESIYAKQKYLFHKQRYFFINRNFFSPKYFASVYIIIIELNIKCFFVNKFLLFYKHVFFVLKLCV